MEIKNGKAYLTIHEQQYSGLPSPIDTLPFDFHGLRVEADRELQAANEERMNEDILPPAKVAEIQERMFRANARSEIARGIARHVAQDIAIEEIGVPNDISSMKNPKS